MPVYTVVKENKVAEKRVSDEAINLVESAIQQVLSEGKIGDAFGKFGAKLDASAEKAKEIGKNIGYAAHAVQNNAKEAADKSKASADKAKANMKSAAAYNKQKAQSDKSDRAKAAGAAAEEREIVRLEMKKKKQNGELLPSEQKKLDDLYANQMAREIEA